jgi:hypothetical protein
MSGGALQHHKFHTMPCTCHTHVSAPASQLQTLYYALEQYGYSYQAHTPLQGHHSTLCHLLAGTAATLAAQTVMMTSAAAPGNRTGPPAHVTQGYLHSKARMQSVTTQCGRTFDTLGIMQLILLALKCSILKLC